MLGKLVSIGLFGVMTGAFTGFFVFGSITSAIGIASAMGVGMCALTVAIGSEKTERSGGRRSERLRGSIRHASTRSSTGGSGEAL